MIRLFLPTEKKFETNGEIVINATRCAVKNGTEFSLELVCPVEYCDYIENGNILAVPTPSGEQPFRIFDVAKGLHKITARAKHITYDAENYLIADATAEGTCQQALNIFNAATDTESPFLTVSDVQGEHSMTVTRKSLNETINSVSERWGGHIVRDMWKISILESIERDNGITIEYGKNLQDITADYNFAEVVTKLLPVGKDGITLDGLYVESSTQYDTPYSKVVNFDQDIEREDYSTDEEYQNALKADLYEQAADYLTAHCVPSVNYTLKGKPEKVSNIGDLILVKDKRLGIDLITEVIAYEWDAIGEKYNALEFGNFKDNLGNLLDIIKSNTVKIVKENNTTIETKTEQAIQETAEEIRTESQESDQALEEQINQKTAQLNQQIERLRDAIDGMVDKIYPVGSIYIGTTNTDPATMFGGTWTQIKDKFLLSSGDTYPAGSTGGTATATITTTGTVEAHKLTMDEMPSHKHSINNTLYFYQGDPSIDDLGYFAAPNYKTNKSVYYDSDHTLYAGGGSGTQESSMTRLDNNAHSHDFSPGQSTFSKLPPYLAVYVWQRTA